MNQYFNKIIISITFIFCRIKGEFDYEFTVPEFICDEATKSGTTTIGLSGTAELNFNLDFQRLSNPCRNKQKCNLTAWKVVREFERFLNSYPYLETNAIEFNNSMLLPGLRYIFNVGITRNKARKYKQFSLDFIDDSYTNLIKKPIVSITLIGPVWVDAHMPYISNAKLNICSNISDYYFQWMLFNEKRDNLETFPDRGSELTVPAFSLESGKRYFIQANLIKLDTNETMTSGIKSLNVKNIENSLIVKLPVVYTTTNVQQSISIKPYIMDLGNKNGELLKEWICIYNNRNLCKNQKGDTLNIENGFVEEGEYKISIKVTKGSMTKTASSTINVMKNVPSIEIDTVTSPIVPSSGFEIKANVEDVRTFCALQWKSEQRPYFIDLNEIPGNVSELVMVFVRRDLFLMEIEEYSNDVSHKNHDLKIPPPTGNWQGLPSRDTNYKLRFILEAKCPKIQLQENKIEVEYSQEILNDTLTVSALVEIDVNVPPKLQPLNVWPLQGVALETVFSFQTTKALVTGTEPPFLYKFGYFLGNREFVFCNMLDHTRCETLLPYNVEGVKTFLEVCDSFNSCGKTYGPVVNTAFSDNTDGKLFLQIFKEKLNSEDFYKTFGWALTVLDTYKTAEGNCTYIELFFEEVSEKIQYLHKSYDYENKVNWAKRINKLINQISDFNKEFAFNDEVLDGLVQLRSKLLAIEKEDLRVLHRKLLAVDAGKFDINGFKSYLQVSDLIITGSNNQNKVELEKNHLHEKINEYKAQLCRDHKKVTVVELNSVVLVVEALPKKSYDNVHVIPYKGNSWNTFAKIKLNTEDLPDGNLYIVKTAYRNFFNRTGVSYEVAIVDLSDGNRFLENIRSTVLLPVVNETEMTDKVPQCVVYNNEGLAGCRVVQATTEYVQCSCAVLGRFYLEYADRPDTTGSQVENFHTTGEKLPQDQETFTEASTTTFDLNVRPNPTSDEFPAMQETSSTVPSSLESVSLSPPKEIDTEESLLITKLIHLASDFEIFSTSVATDTAVNDNTDVEAEESTTPDVNTDIFTHTRNTETNLSSTTSTAVNSIANATNAINCNKSNTNTETNFLSSTLASVEAGTKRIFDIPDVKYTSVTSTVPKGKVQATVNGSFYVNFVVNVTLT